MRRSLSLVLLAALFVSCSSHGPKPVVTAGPPSRGAPKLARSTPMRKDPAAIRTAVAEDPANAAWSLFIELNEPVAGAGTKVWETDFRQTSSVYLLDGGVPPPWGQVPPPPGLPAIPPAPEGCEDVSPAVRHNLDTTIQVDGRDLLDKWHQPVRYQLLMNEPTFKYIVDRQFYNVNGQEKAAAAVPPQPANFPSTSYELKTSWLWLGTDAAKCAEIKGKYYVVNGYYQIFDRDGQPAGWEVGYAALAGMHIINKAQKNWVWITFENVYDKDFTAARLELPLTPETQTANQTHQSALAGQQSVFANYQLDGVQTEFLGSGGQPTLLANSTIESAFQTQSSCITCHHTASIKPNGEYFNFAYTQNGNLNYYVGTPPGQSGYNFLDYVWSMKRAHRQRTAAVHPDRIESKEVSQ
ncbi:MAG TPA: hypothetical protein VGS07_32120 [Thermoanaerobaculia bacterium]|nr:hypothetical protein [Thermoanaerobaculia bacterium]